MPFITHFPLTDNPGGGYEEEVNSSAVKKIILEAMNKEDVEVADIPHEGLLDLENCKRSKRYFYTKGFAWFKCPKRHKNWPSAHAWCVIDLKRKKICHRDYQKCNKCDSKADPNFTEESLERMAEYAVKQFLIRTHQLPPSAHVPHTDMGDIEGGPHDEERCGKCKRLGRSCWK